ncbi:protein dispatched homolog 1-like [Tubulanus polymorphus]|uniref:protein dispatched homolog 1-like n=1 Tax=Tubulanus polymorphus TaxID=672921 RepID=UPI003DA3718B
MVIKVDKNGTVRTEDAAFSGDPKVVPELTEAEFIKYEFVRERDKDPLKFCRWMAESPRVAFAVMLSLQTLPFIITAALMVSGYSLFPVEFTGLPLDLNDVTRQRAYAWRYRKQATGYSVSIVPTNGTNVPTWSRSYSVDGLELIYEKPGYNILTKAHLQAMKSFEDQLYNDATYQAGYCQLDSYGQCKKPDSLLRFFDGTYSYLDSRFNDPNFENVNSVMWLANNTAATREQLQYHLGNDITLTVLAATSGITRSLIPFGWPLEGNGNKDANKDNITEFMKSNFLPLLEKNVDSKVGGMDLIYYSSLLFSDSIQKQAIWDMLLAVGSMVFIFVVIYAQTSSLWVTSWAVFGIISSFLLTNIVYAMAIGFKYFGFFHILSIFIILGIGADDIFVYCDNWKYSRHLAFKSLAHRVSFVYRRSSATMLITSLTTMIAFLASAFSPLLAVQTFGIFSGILIFANYCSVILFLPTVVTLHEVYFSKYDCLCCTCSCCYGCCDNTVEPDDSRDRTDFADAPKSQNMKEFVADRFYDCFDSEADAQQLWVRSSRGIVRCFGDGYFRFVSHKVMKWVIFVFFLSLAAVASYFVSKLEPDERSVRLFVDSHNFGKAADRRLYSFKPLAIDPSSLSIYLVWGLLPRDFSDCDFSDYQCRGTYRADNAFTMNTQANQQAIMDLCSNLKNLNAADVADLRIDRHMLTNELKVACFAEPLRSHMAIYNTSLPLLSTNTKAFMTNQTSIYNMSSLPASFNNFAEIGITHWLTDAYQFKWTSDWEMYNGLLGQVYDTYTGTVSPTGTYGSKLRYMAIQINTTVNYRSLAFTDGLPLMQKWENFMQKQLKTMPADLQNGFQCTRFIWHWLKVQQSLFYNALIGIGIGLGLAVPVILFATQNVLLTFISFLTLAGITVCVCGMIPLLGWKLGVLESLNMCLVVGLSIDYCVHLAEGYHHSLFRQRLHRLRDTLERVGVSVLSGAATTLGASVFMLFAKIQFFVQFGIFMFCTIGFSILFSLFFFVSLLAIFGPENEDCSFQRCCRKHFCKEDVPTIVTEKVEEIELKPEYQENL